MELKASSKLANASAGRMENGMMGSNSCRAILISVARKNPYDWNHAMRSQECYPAGLSLDDSILFKAGERAVEDLARQPQFGGHILKLPV